MLKIDRPLTDKCTVQEEGIDHISRLLESPYCRIQLLSLKSHCVGDLGAKHLALSLKNNNTLTHLDLERNRIGPHGYEALAAHFRLQVGNNTSLRTLLLSFNRVGDEGALALAEVGFEALHENIDEHVAFPPLFFFIIIRISSRCWALKLSSPSAS